MFVGLMPVDHEVDPVAVDAVAGEVGHLPDAEQVAARVERRTVRGELSPASTFSAMGARGR
jgi:hypothetical protein